MTSDPENYGKGKRHRNPAVSQCTLSSSSIDESSKNIQHVLDLFPPSTPFAVTPASYSKNIQRVLSAVLTDINASASFSTQKQYENLFATFDDAPKKLSKACKSDIKQGRLT